jgi:hypothetical protein
MEHNSNDEIKVFTLQSHYEALAFYNTHYQGYCKTRFESGIYTPISNGICYFQVPAVQGDTILGIAPVCAKSKENNYFVYRPFANLGGDLKSPDPNTTSIYAIR